jgi:site-specific DNA-methyltransferase (adenine-specific)
MSAMGAGSIDVMVTSPPYNIGVPYGRYDDSGSREDYLTWTCEWASQAHRVLSDNGSLFLNLGGKPSDPYGPFEVVMRLRQDCGFHLQNVIHWIKSIVIEETLTGPAGHNGRATKYVARGHYKPVNSDRYLNSCQEYIFHITKTGLVALDRLSIGVPYQDKSNVSRWSSAAADKRCRGNTWFIPYDTIRNRALQRPHPATFPLRLPEMCIRLHGLDRTNTVLDPFMGIGSTAIASVRLGKSVIGYELDPEYFNVSAARMEEVLSAPQTSALPS